MENNKDDESRIREELADLQHQQWSGWMEYLFSKCRSNPEVTDELIIPAWAVQRWLRQSQTFYKNLPEEEKESDRIEADKYLSIIQQEREKAYEEGKNFYFGLGTNQMAFEAGAKVMAEKLKPQFEINQKHPLWYLDSGVHEKIDQALQSLLQEKGKHD